MSVTDVVKPIFATKCIKMTEKISLYDLLTFLIPGGTLVCFMLWLFPNVFWDSELMKNTPELLSAVPFLFFSYFVGHVISLVGRKTEPYFGAKEPWTNWLKKGNNAERVNQKCQQHFGFEFLMADKSISVELSDKCFDQAFYLLESKQMLEKVAILKAQYAFFRNSIALFLLLALLFVSAGWYWSLNQYYFTAATFLLPLFIAIRLMRDRESLMMAAVYQSFLTIK